LNRDSKTGYVIGIVLTGMWERVMADKKPSASKLSPAAKRKETQAKLTTAKLALDTVEAGFKVAARVITTVAVGAAVFTAVFTDNLKGVSASMTPDGGVKIEFKAQPEATPTPTPVVPAVPAAKTAAKPAPVTPTR
jgi:hypothetical protein